MISNVVTERLVWKDVIMPKPFPKEFRDDVIRVAENRDPGMMLAQITRDFGVHVGTLDKWMRQARIAVGGQPGETKSESAELRELRKRNWLLEEEVEVLRRATAYPSRAHLPGKCLPARERACLVLYPRGGLAPGVEARSPALLPLVEDPRQHTGAGGGVAGERVVRRSPGRPRVRVSAPD